MKGHITKMHNKLEKCKTASIKPSEKEDLEEIVGDKTNHIYEEANKVVTKLLNDEADDSIENIELVSLDETLEEGIDASLKQYHNKCENCDFTAVATKRYGALQLLSKHKQSCCSKRNILKSCERMNTQCSICDFETKSHILLKRHMRDDHAIKTGSTSPPLKKKRTTSIQIVSEDPMDIEETDVADLSATFEQMDVEDSEEAKERSNLNDKKIKEKEQMNEEKEKLYKNKVMEAEKKKEKVEEQKHDQINRKNKKQKQVLKDQRKSVNKGVKRKTSLTDANKIHIRS